MVLAKAKAGIQGAYDSISESWDENRRRPFSAMPLFAEEFQRRFSRRAGTLLHAKILDAGCGNARNAIWLCKRFPAACIHCCDVSAGMLLCASKNIAAACKAHSCVIWRADVTSLRHHPCRVFDAVLCTAVLHHIQSRDGWVRALSEMRRVLKPGGFAFVTVWSDKKQRPGADRKVAFPSKQGNKICRPYHFFSRRELEAAARKAGFEVAKAFLESKGKIISAKDKARNRNLCLVLQNPSRGKEGRRKESVAR
jgi:ubiquinone/menaquinone biosynthesis C-methylase UbiE